MWFYYMYFRLISFNDYTNYMSLINEFRPTFLSKIQFINAVKKILSYGQIWLVIDDVTSEIVGTGTIIYEQKIIHNGGLVAHIEDVVVAEKYRKKGYGRAIVEELKRRAREKGCYKILLNCSKNMEKFYEKNGFSNHNLEMEFRF